MSIKWYHAAVGMLLGFALAAVIPVQAAVPTPEWKTLELPYGSTIPAGWEPFAVRTEIHYYPGGSLSTEDFMIFKKRVR